MAHYLFSAPEKTCNGKGKDAVIAGIPGYVCPHENGTSDCVYPEPKSGCPTAVGGGGQK